MDKSTDMLSGVPEPFRSLLADAGHSHNSLAAAAGIPRSTLGRRFRDPQTFTMRELLAIAEVLGVSPADLLPSAFGLAVSA